MVLLEVDGAEEDEVDGVDGAEKNKIDEELFELGMVLLEVDGAEEDLPELAMVLLVGTIFFDLTAILLGEANLFGVRV
jgi:hypothetical protein